MKRIYSKFDDNYLVVKLMGGFGNQMFQYVFGLVLQKNGGNVFFDTSWFDFERRWNRSLDLPRAYNLELRMIGNLSQLKNFYPNSIKLKLRFITIIKRLFSINKYFIQDLSPINIYVEDTRFSKKYFLSKNKGYFDGYWQSLDYIKLVENELFEAFSFKQTKSDEYFYFKTIIDQSEKNCSLHWRRGDYLESKVVRVLTENYFAAALNYIISNRELENVFVFSEDCDHVKYYLEPLFPNLAFYYAYDVFHEQGYFHEVRLMSECKNNIISNSTFSWWGAYLNKNQDKMVITPNFGSLYGDFIPEDWIILDID